LNRSVGRRRRLTLIQRQHRLVLRSAELG
jgi:hypothetical protein